MSQCGNLKMWKFENDAISTLSVPNALGHLSLEEGKKTPFPGRGKGWGWVGKRDLKMY